MTPPDCGSTPRAADGIDRVRIDPITIDRSEIDTPSEIEFSAVIFLAARITPTYIPSVPPGPLEWRVSRSVRLIGPWFLLAHLVALHLALSWFDGADADGAPLSARPTYLSALGTGEVESTDEAAEIARDDRADRSAITVPARRPGPLDPSRIYTDGDVMRADLQNGWVAELTTVPALQDAATRILNRGKVPFGAVVLLDVKSGDVLAMADRFDAEHSVAPDLDPEGPPHLALRALAPSASVFKIVTAAALLEVGVSGTREYAYTPAKRRVYDGTLDKPGAGAPRVAMGDALASSNNGFFARMADRKLAREDVDLIARRFGFNRVVPFPLLTDASTASVPRNRLERARMAAGFWHTRLTPLHAALIAAAVAGDGSVPTPRMVRRLEGPDGRLVDAPDRGPLSRAMKAETAAKMRTMMARTVTHGTGRRAFSKWPRSLSKVTVAGKTGTLDIREPYTAYTWFVGFAPADDPQVAIAVMVGNGELWWQRAIDIGRDVLADYFRRQG